MSVNENVDSWFATVPATVTQFADQIKIIFYFQNLLVAFQESFKNHLTIPMEPLFQRFLCHHHLFDLLLFSKFRQNILLLLSWKSLISAASFKAGLSL